MRLLAAAVLVALISLPASARQSSDFDYASVGDGPHERLVIRGATMIEGSDMRGKLSYRHSSCAEMGEIAPSI